MQNDEQTTGNERPSSRIPEFYKFTVPERLRALRDRGIISDPDLRAMLESQHVLSSEGADKMVENVVGVFGLPMGLGLNFLINNKEYVVPLVVEEPSIIAALSSAAKLAREGGGFVCESTESILVGQVQIVDAPHASKAQHAILQHKDEIINLANSLHPKMVARGGGAIDVEVMVHPSASAQHGDMVVVHLLVNTCDAMGANLVNSMCEGVAPLIEKISKGKVFLRILSNLTDRALVRAKMVVPTRALHGKGYTGEEVRDGVILANEFAAIDPYRAATHNKGIMNGIDAVALATGNDWRALEAAAHAYAARGQSYTSLTKWYKDDAGNLVGTIEIPIKVGTVGGNLQSNPAVGMAHRILKVQSARELAEVMGAVGLAQNFSAIRALATDGISQGHMTLHARSVAVTAGATPEIFDHVVEMLVQSGEIKVWKAQDIIQSLRSNASSVVAKRNEHTAEEGTSVGYGKVVLLGEHAAVYGSHVVAAPLALTIKAKVEDAQSDGVQLIIPAWDVQDHLRKCNDNPNSFHNSLDVILNRLHLRDRNMCIKVYPHVPRAMGLGGSAALAVAVIRALSNHYKLNLSDNDVNGLAFESEKIAHGTPSGIDNAMATYGRFMLYKKSDPVTVRHLNVPRPIPIVIGISGVESLTAKMVARVGDAWRKNKSLYERIFNEINDLSLQGAKAIEAYDLETLGELMNICQGLLNALQVSSWELEELIQIARHNGALGAKLTGGGGGGSMIAVCADAASSERVAEAIRRSGYKALMTQVGAHA